LEFRLSLFFLTAQPEILVTLFEKFSNEYLEYKSMSPFSPYLPAVLFFSIIFAPIGFAAQEDSQGEKASKTASRYVKIGHYQCVCRQGDFQRNLGTVIHGLELATEARLDIVSFPESLLTGYYRKEQDAWANSFAIDSPEMKEVLAKTARFEPLLMVGFNEQRDGKLFNTIAVIEKGKLLGHYSKAMPIFPYFKPGRHFPVFEKKGLKFGVIICADGGYIEPARILSLKGARVIFAPHFNFVSSPVKHFLMVRNDHVARAVENGVYFLRGNNVESERSVEGLGDLGFGYGDSYLLDPNGQIVASAGLYHEGLIIYNLALARDYRARHNRRSHKSADELLGVLSGVLDKIH